MHRSPFATVIAIGLLFACSHGSAEERTTSSRQRFTIHVPHEVKFGLADPSAVTEPAALPAKQDAESLIFMAETTSGMTIQFETKAEPARMQPLKLTVGGGLQGSWWANGVDNAATSMHESVAEGASVQASTLGAGWTRLTIGTTRPATPDGTMMTIVITIVAH